MENVNLRSAKTRRKCTFARMRASTMELNRLIRMKVNLSVDWQLVFHARANFFSFFLSILRITSANLLIVFAFAARSCVRNLLSGK